MTLPDRDHPFWAELPDWVKDFRPHQLTATEEIIDWFERGKKVVLLDAPTGTGKTLIAEMVRVALNRSMIYTATTKYLQDQFEKDFPCAVIKGRANYPTETGPPHITADDCTKRTDQACIWCPNSCPYERALAAATASRRTCTNTAYLLSYQKPMLVQNRLCVIDEADELEQQLIDYANLHLSTRMLRMLGFDPPPKGARSARLHDWLVEYANAVKNWSANDLKTAKQKRILSEKLGIVLERYALDPKQWLRTYERDGFELKLLIPAPLAANVLWKRPVHRWLAMSATFVGPEVWAQNVGIVDSFGSYGFVRLDSSFGVEQRPVRFVPVEDMSGPANEHHAFVAARWIAGLAKTHPDEPILVHTVSNGRLNLIKQELELLVGEVPVHAAIRKETKWALSQFKRHGGILLAANMARGVDLPDDLCRHVVIVKIPYPGLDRWTQARMSLPGGNKWYLMQTIRTLLQMCGRGVRHENDYAVTWIIDAAFQKLWRDNALFPSWWRQSVKRLQNPF